MDIPTGFRFCPSDKELLSYYLTRRLKGEPTQFQIPDEDLYGIEPWRLFSDIDQINESHDDDDIDDEATYSNNLAYVFTSIKKKHGNETKRISRIVTTPSSKNKVIGTWKDQKATDIIDMVSKKIIGAKRMLSFMPAPSKKDHDDDDDEDNEGSSKKRKRKQIIIDQLDGISYIMHEYSMAGSSYVLCRIRRKIDKKKKKKMTRKNTGAAYDQPLHGSRMSYDDHHQMTTNTSVLLDHNQSLMLPQPQPDQDAQYDQQGRMSYDDNHQMTTNTSVLLDHNQSSMFQQQQPDQDAEYDQQQGMTYDDQQQGMTYDDDHQIMMNTSVLDHDQSSMWQQQQPDQDAEDDQLLQGRMTFAKMMNAPTVLYENESSMRQQQPVQSEAGGSPILIDDEEDGFTQMLEDDLSLDNTTSTSTSNGDEDKITGTGHEEVVEEEEDLSNQQQQQQQQESSAPASEQEYNLSSIDFQSDDSLDFGHLYFPSLERFHDPLDIIALGSY